MPDAQAQKMRHALQAIAAGCTKGLNFKWMNNLNAYRLRQGNFRAIYAFRDEGKLAVVARIGTRGDIYK